MELAALDAMALAAKQAALTFERVAQQELAQHVAVLTGRSVQLGANHILTSRAGAHWMANAAAGATLGMPVLRRHAKNVAARAAVAATGTPPSSMPVALAVSRVALTLAAPHVVKALIALPNHDGEAGTSPATATSAEEVEAAMLQMQLLAAAAAFLVLSMLVMMVWLVARTRRQTRHAHESAARAMEIANAILEDAARTMGSGTTPAMPSSPLMPSKRVQGDDAVVDTPGAAEPLTTQAPPPPPRSRWHELEVPGVRAVLLERLNSFEKRPPAIGDAWCAATKGSGGGGSANDEMPAQATQARWVTEQMARVLIEEAEDGDEVEGSGAEDTPSSATSSQSSPLGPLPMIATSSPRVEVSTPSFPISGLVLPPARMNTESQAPVELSWGSITSRATADALDAPVDPHAPLSDERAGLPPPFSALPPPCSARGGTQPSPPTPRNLTTPAVRVPATADVEKRGRSPRTVRLAF